MNDALDDIADCTETYEQLREKLERVERELATRLDIFGARPRRRLIDLDRNGLLEEDELVMRWHDLYASYQDWVREGGQESIPPPSKVKERLEGAAAGGPSAFVCPHL